MGMRAKWQQFRTEWAETSIPAEKPRRVKPAGECRQVGCGRSAERDGFCRGCWSAVFGSAAFFGGGQ